MNFVRSCLHHESNIVRSVAWYSVLHGHYRSPTGRNVLFCLGRYNCTFNDLLSYHSINHIISQLVSASHTEVQRAIASLSSECFLLCDGSLHLPGCFSHTDINDIIMDLSVT